MGPAADNQHVGAGPHARLVDHVMADGERLRRRALAEAEALRQPERIARIDADVLGVGTGRAEARDDVVGAVDAHSESALAARTRHRR